MNTLGERIKTLRKTLKLNQTSFAEQIGFKQTAVGFWENGNRNVSESTIKLICSEFNVKEKWLRTGEGEMFNHAELEDVITELQKTFHLTDFDAMLVREFATLDPVQRKVFTDFIDTIIANRSSMKEQLEAINEFDVTPSARIRPLYDIPASAGTGIELNLHVPFTNTELPGDAPNKVDFGVKISGDSMSPDIPDGSVVWVKNFGSCELIPRHNYIVAINNEAFCKQWNGKKFISINKAYGELDIIPDDTVQVQGEVLYIQTDD